MNTSVIRYRVADFLKTYAPFDALPEQALIELAGQGRVKFHEGDEYVFRQGQAKAPWVWVIQQGKVELVVQTGEEAGRLRDVLGEGDLLGLEQFLGDGSYLASARTVGDVLLYAIDARAFEELAARFPAVKRYLAAHFSDAGIGLGRRSWLDAEAPTMEFLEARRHARADAPPGIEGAFTTRSAVRRMMGAHCEALAVGERAVLTASDLAWFCDRNPAGLRREMEQASSIAELAPLMRQAGRMILEGLAHPSDVDDCAAIATEMAAAATAACIRFAQQDVVAAGIEAPESRFCWLAFGTLARGEMLRLAPPRIGVVFDDGGLADATDATMYFNAVAGQVGAWFQACGWEGEAPAWPEGANPCMPLPEWKRFFRETVRKPYEHDLFSRRELFDVRDLSGDAGLLEELTGDICSELEQTGMLIPLLANDSLGHLPPLTVFRGLVLEADGTERATLDLAEFVVNPISDAARVLALGKAGAPIQTLERLEAAAAGDPAHAAVYKDAVEAFRFALYHQAVAGTAVIEPSTLGRLDQRLMKTAFASILRLLELTASRFELGA
ncbi:MAG TPA: putative nucleotidyltransferase substrate binding domain-containing protein [Bryobacteraceae bacterium]|jgi:signal-transduction protein with cAMP-binding, CBS, and nucleotidyltransferase domain